MPDTLPTGDLSKQFHEMLYDDLKAFSFRCSSGCPGILAVNPEKIIKICLQGGGGIQWSFACSNGHSEANTGPRSESWHVSIVQDLLVLVHSHELPSSKLFLRLRTLLCTMLHGSLIIG